ncbi:FG-GAP repeat domain-containing protein [Phormidesmis priestleyi]
MSETDLSTATPLTVSTALLSHNPLDLTQAADEGYRRLNSSLDKSPIAAVQSAPSPELFWYDTITATTTTWVMDGTTKLDDRYLNPDTPITDFNWKAVGTGDFSRDGQDDILWRNSVTGQNAWWVMQGNRLQSVAFLASVPDPNWNIVGTGDFNRDGQVDILWRHAATGDNVWWLMNDTTIASVNFPPIERTLSKAIVGVGDYNQDGQLDLLWRDSATGENCWWVMNGSTIVDQPLLPPVAPNLNWKIIGTRDLNNDGQSDIVWRNTATGDNTVWLMNGTSIANTVALPKADPRWQLIGFLNAIAAPSMTPALSVVSTNVVAVRDADTLTTAQIKPSAIFSLIDRVDSTDLNNFYRFNLSQSGVFAANLTGLTGDADVRLIQDKNQNGAIDADEILAWQWERGTTSESIRRFLAAGDYLVQVMSYGGQAANYSLGTSFTAALKDPQAFEFGITFGQSLSGLTQAARDAIVSAASFWEGIITSRSAITRSNQLNVVIRGESLNNSNGTPDAGTLALSGPDFDLDGPNLVISGGSSTLNLRRAAEFDANPGYLREIMIHEFAHILGFGTLWEPARFMNSNGTIFSIGKLLIDRTTSTYSANSYAGWAYGELMGVSGQVAVPIEPQIFAHWDESRFDAELMTPFAETPGVLTPTSQLTLAALRDLGWNINMGAAQAYTLPGRPSVVPIQAAVANDGTQAAYRSSCACGSCLVAASRVHAISSLSDALPQA